MAKKRDALKFKLAALAVCVGAAVLKFGAAFHPEAPAVGTVLCVVGGIVCVGLLGRANNQKDYLSQRRDGFFRRIYSASHPASSGPKTVAAAPTETPIRTKPTQPRNDGLNV